MKYTVPGNLIFNIEGSQENKSAPSKDEIEAALSRRVRPAKLSRPKTKMESKADIPV